MISIQVLWETLLAGKAKAGCVLVLIVMAVKSVVVLDLVCLVVFMPAWKIWQVWKQTCRQKSVLRYSTVPAS
jgi:hypothetical protein